MVQKQMLKQMVEFNQIMFDNFSQALKLFPCQFGQQIANFDFDQANWLPSEAFKATENWDKSFLQAVL